MSNTIEYSVLRYSPSIISGERINLGILFTDSNGELHEFKHTKKWNRIKEFDDELDIDILKLLLKSIKSEVECLQEGRFEINRFTRYFTNEFRFDKPIGAQADDLDATIDFICKLYLRYDYEKGSRPSKEEELNFVSRILKERKIEYKRNQKVIGVCNDPSVYDYVFLNYGIKIISLKKKEISRMFNDIKAWAWNCQYNKSVIKTIILYDFDVDMNEVNRARFESVIKILKQSSDYVFPMTEGLSFIGTAIPSK